MRIAATGFVSAQSGSVASANALLLRALLDSGCEISFFSKASFVDPRPVVGDRPNFQFTDVDNRAADRARAKLAGIPVAGPLAGILDASTYSRLLVGTMRDAHAQKPFQVCLWLGDYARGAIPGLPTVSFVQGPPGTDARSVLNHFDNIRKIAGPLTAWKWRLMAQFRLSRFGLPPFSCSDHFIVGSDQSRRVLQSLYRISPQKVDAMPYPIDLDMFRPTAMRSDSRTLHCLWLGRIIPRKRLDLFLDGASMAIQRGADLQLTIVGGIGFIPGYEALIRNFPFPDRLNWKVSLPREEVPEIIAAHDVLVQCSEEENFGSSVAEAQACGRPVIVGLTNGNADYLSPSDIRLDDYQPETLAHVLETMHQRKQADKWGDFQDSRRGAEQNFSLEQIAGKLLQILNRVVRKAEARI